MIRKLGAFLTAFATAGILATPAIANPSPWEIGLQPAADQQMARIHDLHNFILVIITLICLFVLGLLVTVMIRFNAKAHPVPSTTTHNTLLEVAWTVIPVLILTVIAIPSFRLLYFEADVPSPDVTIKAIGKQWYWTYEYPNQGFTFDALMIPERRSAAAGEPRLLGANNPVVVPVNKVVKVETTGADVIHSWAVPAFGVKMDAVPGRINVTWFKADKLGTFYGQCSELCGARHAFMPIEVHVVTQQQYDAWLAQAKQKFAAIKPSQKTQFAAAQ